MCLSLMFLGHFLPLQNTMQLPHCATYPCPLQPRTHHQPSGDSGSSATAAPSITPTQQKNAADMSSMQPAASHLNPAISSELQGTNHDDDDDDAAMETFDEEARLACGLPVGSPQHDDGAELAALLRAPSADPLQQHMLQPPLPPSPQHQQHSTGCGSHTTGSSSSTRQTQCAAVCSA